MTTSTAAWVASPAIDADTIMDHLARHDVFAAAGALFDRCERGEPLGKVYSADEVRSWLAERGL